MTPVRTDTQAIIGIVILLLFLIANATLGWGLEESFLRNSWWSTRIGF